MWGRRPAYNGGMSTDRRPWQWAVVIAGPPAAVALAWVLSRVDHAGGGLTLANAALAMAVVTIAAALTDWLAGAVTSVAAALSLNYFHTEPLRTLRVTDSRDVWSIVLLGALGLAVSAITAARVRRGMVRIRATDGAAAEARVRALVTESHAANTVWGAAIAATANDLALLRSQVVAVLPVDLPTISCHLPPGGGSTTLVLPPHGAGLRLEQAHSAGGWLVIAPSDGMGALTLDRRAVLAFAATLEAALDPSEPDRRPATVTS